jgi:phosphinothricin acetyltransferase
MKRSLSGPPEAARGGRPWLPAFVRLAVREDLPAIVAIYNQAVAERNAAGDLEPKRLEDQIAWYDAHPPETYPVFVCVRDGDAEVVGWSSVSAYRPGRQAMRDVGEVSHYVAREHRGQGVGSRLVDHTLRDCRRTGKRVLIAVVMERNAGSLALLTKHGFRQWGFLPESLVRSRSAPMGQRHGR